MDMYIVFCVQKKKMSSEIMIKHSKTEIHDKRWRLVTNLIQNFGEFKVCHISSNYKFLKIQVN